MPAANPDALSQPASATCPERQCSRRSGTWNRQMDELRLRMLREPRGYPASNCNLLLPPTIPGADAGFVIMEQVEYPPMSGTNTICVVTALIETGIVPCAGWSEASEARHACRTGGSGCRGSPRQGFECDVYECPLLRRSSGRAGEGSGAGHSDCRCGVWRNVLRDCGCRAVGTGD